MLGLVIKDFVNLRKQAGLLSVIVVAYIILFAVAGDYFAVGPILSILCAMLPVTAMAYDEKANWDKYALTMPISRGQVVLSKYLLGYMLTVFVFILNMVLSMVLEKLAFMDAFIIAGIYMMVSSIYLAIMLPIIFKFGVEKGRILMLVGIFVPVIITMFLSQSGIEMPSEQQLQDIAWLFPALGLLLPFISAPLSIAFYKKKEF